MIRALLRRAARFGLRRPGRLGAGDHQLLFAFPGGSGDRPESGRELYRQCAVFRRSIEEVGAVVEELLGWPAAAGFRGAEITAETPEMARRNEIIRLGLLQLAQVDLWRDEGVMPGGVAALSLGEIVAPYAAGVLSLADSARVLAVMSHAISCERTPGRMFHLRTDSAIAQRLCREAPRHLDYLGSTCPGVSMVLGREVDVPALREHLGTWIDREVPSDWSYHTPRLHVDDGWREEKLRGLTSHPATCPIYSAAAGGALPRDVRLDADFFQWMVSRPFRFDRAFAAALDDGFDFVLNLGALPATRAPIRDGAFARGREVIQVDASRADEEVAAWRAARAALRPLRRRVAVPRPLADPRTLHFTDPAFTTDPFRAYEELRRAGPVQYLDRHGFWLVLGFEEVTWVLREPRWFSSRVLHLRQIDPVLLGTDPPEHTVVRRLLSRHLTSAAVERRAKRVEPTAERLLRPLSEGRELEVVGGLANPLAAFAGADILGLDPSDVATLEEHTLAAAGSTTRLYALLRAPVDELAPRTALYHTLLADAGGSLDEAAVRNIIRLLWIAGTGESRRLLPQTILLLLLKHPEVRACIQADPALLEPFVEEVLRLRPPEHLTVRVTTAAVELAGTQLPAGALVKLCLAAANRDPSRFDRPGEIHLDRPAGYHLSFGGGVHYCMGAPLARAQTLVALRALLRVAPRFRAVQPLCTVGYAPGAPFSQIEQLVIGP